MATKIGIYNRKGGVGKTHSAINIGACLAMKGYKVLLIDADSQCNLSIFFFDDEESGIFNYEDGGLKPNDKVNTLYNVIEEDENIFNAIYSTKNYELRRRIQSRFKKISFKLDILIGDYRMDEVDVDNEHFFSKKLTKLEDDYDYILIDFPPAFSSMVTIYMTACDTIIVPARLGESASMYGYFDVLKKVEMIRIAKFNTSLYVLGLYYTMVQNYKKNQKSQYEETYQEETRPIYNLFDSCIRLDYAANVLADSKGEPLNVCASSSNCAKDYLQLTEEILQRLNEE